MASFAYFLFRKPLKWVCNALLKGWPRAQYRRPLLDLGFKADSGVGLLRTAEE